MPRRFTALDAAALAAFVLVAAILVERGQQRDIEVSSTAVVISAAPTCQEILENRRFTIRRMMIADGSLALGNIWRNDALLGACPTK